LKDKHTIYLYGNHDKKEFADDRVKLFSDVQTDSYKLKLKDKTLVVEHGHRVQPGFPRLEKINPIRKMTFTVPAFESLGVRLFGEKFRSLFVYRHLHNRSIKRYARRNLSENEILICGHTHARLWDPKNRYINIGDTQIHVGSYLYIEDGRMELKSFT
jgi:UDP-2,3-diacylglucosamine pyrophosphatase LpxH